MRLKSYFHFVNLPFTSEPAWAQKVERWSQLDAPAMALTESYWQLRSRLPKEAPQWMLLASPGGSNKTDVEFAAQSQPSPAKFVHTLPNIRSASLLQAMNWSGPILCLQKDPETLVTAVAEGMHLVEAGRGPVWILSVESKPPGFETCILILEAAEGGNLIKNETHTMAKAPPHDTHLKTWLNRSEQHNFDFRAQDYILLNGAFS